MKILVTGGAGYIGSHVVLNLCDLGHKVIVIDDLSHGDIRSVDSRAEFIEGSILVKNDLTPCLKGVDVVIHLAAFKSAGESMIYPKKYLKNNILGTQILLETMIEHDVKDIIFSSTAAVYGDPQYLPINESHPKNPSNFYGYTKLHIENILEWYKKLLGLNYVVLRYFNAAGYDSFGKLLIPEKNPANLIPVVMEVASEKKDKVTVFGNDYDTPDGTGIRDYIHVSDLASAHSNALDLIKNKQSDKINLGSSSQYSVLDIIKCTEKITGKKIPFKIAGRRAGDPPIVHASSDHASKVLNWTASQSDIENIIETTWRIYK